MARRFFERKKSRTQFSRKNIQPFQDRENSTVCFVLIIQLQIKRPDRVAGGKNIQAQKHLPAPPIKSNGQSLLCTTDQDSGYCHLLKQGKFVTGLPCGPIVK